VSLSAPQLRARKRRRGDAPLVMITAYDEPSARLGAAAGADILLVGDSAANVVLGQGDTLHVTLEDMVRFTGAVAAARPDAHVVADLPWLTYHQGPHEAVRSAGALVRAGAQSVKLEGGRNRLEVVRALLDAEIPVMGHLGLTPQSLLAMGGFRVQGKTHEAVEHLIKDAALLQDEGVYALVVEGVPPVVGERLTEALEIPTIGIGAGPATDGQVLVFHDLLGLGARPPARFVRAYADLNATIVEALTRFCADVRAGEFPSEAESYPNPEGLLG
jgi:3-methyl-2-oxobutanoate hydroxymethyltransferase